MKASSALGGLAGAIALTLLNEAIKKVNGSATGSDLLGQNALAKLMKGNDLIPKTAQRFFPLAGDLVTNSMYYGMARGTSGANTFVRGAMLGLSAGIGAVTLPKQLGMEDQRIRRNQPDVLLTIGLYIVGGLVAAAVINALDGKPDPEHPDRKPEPENKELTKAVSNVTREAGKKIAQGAPTEN